MIATWLDFTARTVGKAQSPFANAASFDLRSISAVAFGSSAFATSAFATIAFSLSTPALAMRGPTFVPSAHDDLRWPNPPRSHRRRSGRGQCRNPLAFGSA
jgi:hypothetical protein